jgi:hypothetical protein
MKFFTRELLERCASTDDAVARAAEAEWEAANERYEEHLRAIDSALPEHIRTFNTLLLHDALVWSIARQGDRLLMVLRKDVPPRNLVLLTYTLVDEPGLDPQFLPPGQRLQVMDFLYDELDIVDDGEGKTFRQSVVFGNGWELTLRFSDVQIIQAEPIYPPPDILLVPAAASVLARPA